MASSVTLNEILIPGEDLYRAIAGVPSPISDYFDDWAQERAVRAAGGSDADIAKLRADKAAVRAREATLPNSGFETLKKIGIGIAVLMVFYFGAKLYLESRR